MDSPKNRGGVVALELDDFDSGKGDDTGTVDAMGSGSADQRDMRRMGKEQEFRVCPESQLVELVTMHL